MVAPCRNLYRWTICPSPSIGGSHVRSRVIHRKTLLALWLGRKDSNLQPSDPESAAPSFRHSPRLPSPWLHCSSFHRAFLAAPPVTPASQSLLMLLRLRL